MLFKTGGFQVGFGAGLDSTNSTFSVLRKIVCFSSVGRDSLYVLNSGSMLHAHYLDNPMCIINLLHNACVNVQKCRAWGFRIRITTGVIRGSG